MGIRAVVMDGPGQLGVREFPYPKVAEGAMLVRIILSGICGTDKHTFQGYTAQYSGHAQPKQIPFPIIPGHENVGVIAEMPAPLRDFEGQSLEVGDRVVIAANISCGQCYYCHNGFPYYFCENTTDYGNNLSAADPPHLFGGWAEYLYVLPGSYVYQVPPELPDHHAVMAELMAVTASLDRAKQFDGFRLGDTVLVQGVAALGLCHVIKAQMLGAGQIIATDLSSYRLNLAKEFGAALCLNVSETTLAERRARIADLTQGRGPDVVVECAGVPSAVVEGLELVRNGGMFIEAGNFSNTGDVLINPHRHLCTNNVHLLGIGGEESRAYAPALRQLSREAARFPLDKFVSHRFALEEAGRALQVAMSPDSLKVVFEPSRRRPV